MESKAKPVQLDLFSKINNPEEGRGFEFRHRLSSRVNLSLENIIVLVIFISLSFLLFFSLGVEKGRRQTRIESSLQLSSPKETVSSQEVKPFHASTPLTQTPILKSSPQKSDIELFPKVAKNSALTGVKIMQVVSSVDKNQPGGRKYTIQVASFERDSFAKKEEDSLKIQGYKTILKTSGRFRSLCVGSFNDKQEAEAILRKLRTKYQDCFIRRL